jgi:hypothetical protein
MSMVIARGNHPASELFPMMGDDELSELAADIHKNGLLEPIVLCEGLILDGRNRNVACELADVEPRFTEWSGSSPTLFVISKNLHRRHLTLGQKAAIAVEAVPLFQEESKKRSLANLKHGTESPTSRSLVVGETSLRTNQIVARHVGVSHASVAQAIEVKRDPEEFEKVKRGKTTLNAATNRVRIKAGKVCSVNDCGRAIHGNGKCRMHLDRLKLTGSLDARKNLPTNERAERIRSLVAIGQRREQVAETLGIGIERVGEIARRSGIVFPESKKRKLDFNRIMRETVIGAEGLAAGIELLDGNLDQLTGDLIPVWVESMTRSAGALNRFLGQLKRRIT